MSIVTKHPIRTWKLFKSDSNVNNCEYYEIEETRKSSYGDPPPGLRNKTLAWPPAKPIEEITYPTASPLYINPNPAIVHDRSRSRQIALEKRRIYLEQLDSIKRQSLERSRVQSYRREEASSRNSMDSCSGPTYRRVEVVQTRGRSCQRQTCGSRASSTDSVHRSLTPTRITQPMPRPWISDGSNANEQRYHPIEPPLPPPRQPRKICKRQVCKHECTCESGTSSTICIRQVCEQECVCQPPPPPPPPRRTCKRQICKRECVCENGVIKTTCTRQICEQDCICQPPPPPPPRKMCKKQICKRECVCENGVIKTICTRQICEQECVCEPPPPPPPACQICANLALISDTPITECICNKPKERIIPVEIESHVCELDQQSVDLSCGIPDDHRDFYAEETERDEDGSKMKRRATYEKSVEFDKPGCPKSGQTERVCQTSRTVEERSEEAADSQEESIHQTREQQSSSKVKEETSVQEVQESTQRTTEETTTTTETTEQDQEGTATEVSRSTEVQKVQSSGKAKRTVHETLEEEDLDIEYHTRKDECGKQCRDVRENYRKQKTMTNTENDLRRSLREQVEVHKNLRKQQGPDKKQTLQERRLCAKHTSCPFMQQEEEDETVAEQATCKKTVKFTTETDPGAKPFDISDMQNGMPQEYQSTMLHALTTASDQPFGSLDQGAAPPDKQGYCKKSCHQETYEETASPPPPKPEPEEPLPPCMECPFRPVSPFQKALTTAPVREYTSLGRNVEQSETASMKCEICRCHTPVDQLKEGFVHPAEILYGERKLCKKCCQTIAKSQTPQPLPTPPSNFRLRDQSKSPSRSRSQTPNSYLMTGLRKPDAIPQYQLNLVTTRSLPVSGQEYDPRKTPTSCKSPSQERSCLIKAPRVREDSPPIRRGSISLRNPQTVVAPASNTVHPPHKHTVSYHRELDTPEGHRTHDYTGTKCVHFEDGCDSCGKRSHLEEHKTIDTKNTLEERNTHKKIQESRHYEETSERDGDSRATTSQCSVTQSTTQPPQQNCNLGERSTRFPRTGIRVLPTMMPGFTETKQVTTTKKSKDGRTCQTTTTTLSSTKPKNAPCSDNKPTLTQTKSVCVSPCPDSLSVCVTPCPRECPLCAPKPCTKHCPTNRCSVASDNLPFPQIPLPCEEECTCKYNPATCQKCVNVQTIQTPTCKISCTIETSSSNANQKPRTNLSKQLTQLTVKREKPPVQLYKAEVQCKTIPFTQCQTQYTSQFTSQNCSSNRCENQTSSYSASNTQSSVDPPNLSSQPDLGTGVGGKSGTLAGSTAPKRGRGILNQAGATGPRIPLCGHCHCYVR